jgi:hypothetical protein
MRSAIEPSPVAGVWTRGELPLAARQPQALMNDKRIRDDHIETSSAQSFDATGIGGDP